MTLAADHALYLPRDAGLFTRAKVALRAFMVLKDDNENSTASPVLNAAMDAETFQRIATDLAKSAEGRQLLAERPDLQAGAVDLAALRRLPEGTLGRALAEYYVANGIAPFVSDYPVHSDVEYLAKRYREVHDVVHIITGYGTDVVGELELQAFVLGNIGLKQPLLIIPMVATLRPRGLAPIWTYAHKLVAAYRRGRASREIAVQPRYEHCWSWRIEDVRRAVGITDG